MEKFKKSKKNLSFLGAFILLGLFTVYNLISGFSKVTTIKNLIPPIHKSTTSQSDSDTHKDQKPTKFDLANPVTLSIGAFPDGKTVTAYGLPNFDRLENSVSGQLSLLNFSDS